MSFRDEISESIKTPLQVELEKMNKEIENAKEWAEITYNSIKRELKEKALAGEYTESEDGRIIETEVESTFVYYRCEINEKYQTYRCGFLGLFRKGMYILSCTYKDQNILNVFFDELDNLIKEDGITYSVIGKYTDKYNPKEYTFYVPGSVLVDNSMVFPERIKVYLKVDMKI